VPHGYPPWSGVSKQTVFSLPIDMAELAARLDSPVAYDRRGDVVFLESFERGLARWETGKSGTGSKVGLSAKYAGIGALSVRLRAGSTASHMAYIWRNWQTPSNKQIGLELWYHPVSDYESLGVVLEYYDGTTEHDAAIRLAFNLNEVQYRDDGANWVKLDDLFSYPATGIPFYPLKVVVNFDTDHYLRLLHCDHEYPMMDYPFYTVADARAPSMTVTISHVGVAAANGEVHVDNVIATQDEPVSEAPD
jgi:hypothetical protein